MEITIKNHKNKTIMVWKRSGVIYHDFDELYEIYIKTMNCNNCGIEFINTKNRHLDHNHETGAFRAIVCCSCNINDSYINYPNGKPTKKQINKKYYEKHKEKLLQSQKQYNIDNKEKVKLSKKKSYEANKKKIVCECGCSILTRNISNHIKTNKHIKLISTKI